jgi:anti-sigma factor RsiW
MAPDKCVDGGFESLIVRAADASIGDAEGRRLAAHLEDCAACREALAAQVEARALLVARPPVQASAAFRVRVRQAVEREAGAWSLADVFDFRRWTWRLAPLAAVLAVVATLGAMEATVVETETDQLMSAAAAELPVSAAIYSTSVTDSSLLSMMLSANADDTLGAFGREVR